MRLFSKISHAWNKSVWFPMKQFKFAWLVALLAASHPPSLDGIWQVIVASSRIQSLHRYFELIVSALRIQYPSAGYSVDGKLRLICLAKWCPNCSPWARCGHLLTCICPLGRYFPYYKQQWAIVPPTDINSGALFLLLTPVFGHNSTH